MDRRVMPVLFLMASATVVFAQGASVTGRIVDAQGAVVVNAMAELTSPGAAPRRTRSAADGTFAFGGVPPGAYRLRVEAPGFATWAREVVVLQNTPRMDISLQVAGVSEAVSVISSTAATLTEPSPTASRLGLTPL